MQDDKALSLERSLEFTSATADACRKAMNSLSHGLQQISEASAVGDLRTLRKAREKAAQSLADLVARFTELQTSSRLQEGEYFSSGSYAAELSNVASELGLPLLLRGERIFSPPYEIRILPNEPAVMIGRRRLEKLRPSVLVEEIKRHQNSALHTRPEDFLDVLYSAFSYAAAKTASASEPRRVIPLAEIYELLTILPGTSKNYTIDDFVGDIYLLDRSGTARSKRPKGAALSFVASSGTRSSKVLTTMTPEGVEQKYYAISFSED